MKSFILGGGALVSMALVAPSLAHAQPQPAPAQPAPAAQPAPPAPGTAANPILVPAGCTASTQASGQVVIVCPREPATTTPPPAAPAGPVPAYVPVRSAPPEPPPKEEHKWYGWQTLIVDGAVLVSSAGIVSASPGTGSAIFLSGYALGGPIVHWANGQAGKGFASLGIRIGAPLALGMTGFALGQARDSGGDNSVTTAVYTVLGTMLGCAAAIAIDSAVLARKTVAVEPDSKRARLKLKWQPVGGYDPKQKSVSLGIGGTF